MAVAGECLGNGNLRYAHNRIWLGPDILTGMPEVSRIAKLWFKSHGDDAVAMARDMVADLEESGNMDGAAMWRRIIAVIEKLRVPTTK